jgi:hypothetical protein
LGQRVTQIISMLGRYSSARRSSVVDS